MTDVDVVVVSYNSRDVLGPCVQTLAATPGLNVIVVDNASSDQSLETVAGVTLTAIRRTRNEGFATGCNVGWRAGRAPFVLFLNPDARIAPGDVYRLADVLRTDSGAGAVGPRIVDDTGKIQFSMRRFPRPASTFATAAYLHRIFPRASWAGEEISDPLLYVEPRSTEWISGACLAVSRPVLEQLNGWDEDFFLYAEDIDLCRRIHRLGLRVRYEPSATAVHVGGMSAPRPGLVPVLAWSRVRYAQKHSTPGRAMVERAGIVVETGVRALTSPKGAALRRGNARAALMLLRPLTSTSPRPVVDRAGASGAISS